MDIGTTTSSLDSGQGSASLSDAFVAVPTATGRVAAPEGVSRLSVRRSSRVASSRSRSLQAGTPNVAGPSNTSAPNIQVVDALPGGKRRTGYAYQVLSSVAEETRNSHTPDGPSGNASGPRDTATPRTDILAGRKRAATSAASGSERRAPFTRPMASAADFSPTHFDEPMSDDRVPALPRIPSPQGPIDPSSPARTPSSSPISQNPLVRRSSDMVIHTPSPRRRSTSFRTQDGNAAWAAAEGLLPITEGFTAPGYVPAQVVGGITYSVHSPRRHQLAASRPDVGRQLFRDYLKNGTFPQVPGPQPYPHISKNTVYPQVPATQPNTHISTDMAHPQVLAKTVHPQVPASHIHPQVSASYIHPPVSTANMRQQLHTEPIHSQVSAENVHQQVSASKLHPQVSTENVRLQVSSHICIAKSTPAGVFSSSHASRRAYIYTNTDAVRQI
jgi:hypothetical protein